MCTKMTSFYQEFHVKNFVSNSKACMQSECYKQKHMILKDFVQFMIFLTRKQNTLLQEVVIKREYYYQLQSVLHKVL